MENIIVRESGTTGDCTWVLNDTELTISGNGKMADYNPFYAPWGTRLTKDAPWGTHITKVIIEDGVTSIGKYAFYTCRNLEIAIISNSVTSIGNHAFENCYRLKGIIIPHGVISIGEWAFENCTRLKRVTIGNSVKSIGFCAFSGCLSLTSVTIPDSVTSMGNCAFSDCRKLVEVINHSKLNITAGLLLGKDRVAYCATEVHNGEKSKIVNQNGYLFYTYGGINYLLGYIGTDTQLSLPENYNGKKYELYNYAFCKNDKITSVKISDSVTSIGESAFEGCESLERATIGNSVTNIGPFAFCCRSENLTIHAPAGSYAEQYAKEHGIDIW